MTTHTQNIGNNNSYSRSIGPRVRVGQQPPSQGKAQIRVQKEGDVVVAIQVVCACGETIKIDCQYQQQSDAA